MTTVICLESWIKQSEVQTERIEEQSKRHNLKFYGIDEESNEIWDQSEQKVHNYLGDELDTDHPNI